MKLLDEVNQMKRLGAVLTQYSFPIKSASYEEDINILKQRELVCDGIEFIAYYNNCLYGDVRLRTAQFFGKYTTFLPFWLPCKMARLFLGDDELCFAEIMHQKNDRLDEYCRRIYIWTVYFDKDDNPIPSPFIKKFDACEYQGFKYTCIDNDQVNFF